MSALALLLTGIVIGMLVGAVFALKCRAWLIMHFERGMASVEITRDDPELHAAMFAESESETYELAVVQRAIRLDVEQSTQRMRKLS